MVEPTQSLGEIDLKNSTASELADADLASGTMNGDLLMQCSDGGPSSLLGAGPPSPLTGCYLMIVIGEPHSDEHKDIILQKLLKGFLSWDSSDCQVDLEEELNTITLHAPEGEEARHGERLIQYASENLVTEILIHPQYNTLIQCMRNLLSSFTRHRHIIHAGYTFAGNGSWILQDGTFSVSDFSEAFQENDVQRVLRAYPDTITMDIHCESVGLWSALPDKNFAKSCRIRINPNDVLNSGSDKINSFIDYAAPMIVPASLTDLLESSDVVGNIRFSHPTLYVFPGGQGDAALFGINGFNMLVDGGFGRKACFWDFTRHLDRLDAVLMTRISNCNINGLGAVVERKRGAHVYPQIGHFFCNVPERKGSLSPDGDKDNKDPLLVDLYDKGTQLVNNLRAQSLAPQTCFQDSEPINLYHKVGHGTLDMYVLSPSRDAKEVKEFLQKWNSNDSKLFQPKDTKEFVFPIQNLISICALLVWLPANPEDSITRILFPGSTPDYKIIEGLEKIKHLEFMKNPVCSSKSIAPSISSSTLSKKSIKSVTGGDKASDLIIPQKSMKSVERDNKTLDNKLKDEVAEKRKPVTKPRPSEPAKKIEKIDNKIAESEKIEEPIKEVVKDIDQMEEKEDKEKTIDESETKTDIDTKDEEEKDSGKEKVVEPEIKEETVKETSVEKDETDVIKVAVTQSSASVPAPSKTKSATEPKSAKKPDSKPIKSRIDTRPPRSMATQRQVIKKEEKKEISKPSPTTTPKKTAPQPKETKEIKSKVASRFSRSSPSSTPAKSAKDANNRKVLESKQKIAAAKKEPTPKPAEKKEPVAKPERKPISRRAKAESPSRRPQGSPVKTARPARTKAEKDKGKLEKGGTTDSSSVSTPSADDVAVIKKVIVPTLESKPAAEPITDAPAIVDDLKEEQECIREIEAVFSRDQDKVVKKEVLSDRREIAESSKQDSTTEVEEDEEYLIIEKEEVEQYTEDSINEQESLTKEEEIQKHQRDSEESEKKRKSSVEESQDEKPASKEKAKVVEIIEGVDADKDVVSEKKDNEPEDDDMQPDSIEEDKIPNKEQIKEEVQEIITSAKEIAKTRTESRDELAIKTEEFSTPSIDEKISSNKRTSEETNDDKGEEQIAVERQQIVEQQSHPDEKFSATAESGATTAPTLPEDERIPLDEIKEDLDIIEEKYAKEETKETETPIESVLIKKQTAQPQYSMPPPPTYEPLERQQIPTQIKFDMQQSHLRDIVKTPDEVADLPVHEEVDYVVGYDDYHHPPTTAAPSVPSTGKSIDKKTDLDRDKKTDTDILREVEDQIIPQEVLAKKSEPVKHAEIVPRFSECKDKNELAEKVAEFDKCVLTKVDEPPVYEKAKSVLTALKDDITDSIATAIDLTKQKIENKMDDIKTAKDEITDDIVETAETVKDQIKEEISKVVDEAEKIKDDFKKDVETTVETAKDDAVTKIDDIKEAVSEKKEQIVEEIVKATEAAIDKGKEITEDIKKDTEKILDNTAIAKEKLIDETIKVEDTIKTEVASLTEQAKDTILSAVEDISKKAETIKEKVADKLDHTGEDNKDIVSDAKDKVTDQVQDIKDEVKEKADSVKEAVIDVKDEIVKGIKDVKDESGEKLHEVTEQVKDDIIEDIKDTKDVVEEIVDVKSAAVLGDAPKIEKDIKDTASGKISPVAEKILDKTKDVVDEATEKTDKMMKDTKDMLQDIKDDVVEDTKDKRDSLTDKLTKELDDTKDDIKNKVEDVKDVTSTIPKETEKIVDDLKDDLKTEKEEVSKKSDDIVSDIETNISDAFRGITDSILDFKDKLFSDHKDTKDDMTDVSKVTKDQLMKDFMETKDDTKDKVLNLSTKVSEDIKTDITDIKDIVVATKESLVEDTTTSITETKDTTVEDIKEIKDDIKITTQKIIDEAKVIEGAFEARAAEIVEEMVEKKDELKEKMEDLNDLSAKLDDIKAKTAGFLDDLKLTASEAKHSFSDEISKLHDEIDDAKDEVKEEVLEKADSLKEQMTEKAAILKADAKDLKDKVVDSIKSVFSDSKDEITSKVEDTKEKSAETVSKILDESKDVMDNVVEDIKTVGDKLSNKTETEIAEAKDKVEEKVSKLSDIKDEIKKDVAHLKEDVVDIKEKAKEEIVEQIQAVQVEAVAQVDKVKEHNDEIISKVDTVIDSAKDKIVADVKSQVDDIVQDTKDSVSQATEKIEETKTKVVDETIDVAEILSETIAKATDDVKDETKVIKDQVIKDTGNLIDSFTETKDQLLDDVVQIKEEVKELVGTEISKLAGKIESGVETVTEESKKTADAVIETKDKVVRAVSDAKEQLEDTKEVAAAEVNKVIETAATKIDDTKQVAATEVDKIIETATTKIDDTKDKISTEVSKVADKVETTVEDTKDAIHETIKSAEIKVEDVKEKVASEVASIVGVAATKIEDTRDGVKSEGTKVLDTVDNTLVSVDSKIEDTKDKVKDEFAKVVDSVEATTEDTKNKIDDTLETISTKVEETKEKVSDECVKTVDETVEKIEEVKEKVAVQTSKISGTVEDAKEKVDQTLKTIDATIEDGKEKVSVETIKVVDLTTTKLEETKEKVVSELTKVSDTIEESKDKIVAEVAKTVESAAAKVEDTKEKAINEVAKTADTIESKIDDTKDKMETAFDSAATKIEDTKEKAVAELGKATDAVDEKLIQAADIIDETKAKASDGVAKAIETVDVFVSSADAKIDETKDKIGTEVGKAVDATSTKMEETKEKVASEVSKVVDATSTIIEETKEKVASEVSKVVDATSTKMDETKEKVASEVTKVVDATSTKMEETKEKVASDVTKLVDATSSKMDETKEKVASEVTKVVDATTTKMEETKEKVASDVTNLVDATSTKIDETKEKVASEVTKVVDATSTKIDETKTKIESKIDATKDTIDKEIAQAAETIEKSLDTAKEKIDSVKEEIQEKTKSGISSFFGGISQGIKSGFDKLTDKSDDKVKDTPKEEIELAKKPSPPTFEIKTFPTELRETHITTLDSPIKDQTERVADLKTLEKLPEQTEEEMEEMIKPSMTFQVEEIRYTSPSFDREDSSLNDIKEEEEEDHFSPPRKTSESEKYSRSVSPRTQEDVIKIVANVAEVLKSDKDLEEIIPDFDPEELEKKLSARASPVPMQQSSSPEEDGDDENASKTVQRMLVTASSEDGGGEIEICPQGSITFDGAVSGTATPDLRSGRHSPDELETEEKSDQPKDTTEVPTTFEDEFRQVADTKTDLSFESSTSIKSIPDESKTPQSSGKSTPELKTSPTSIDEKEKHELPEKMQKIDATSKTIPKITSTPPEKVESPVIGHEAATRKESVVSEYIDDAIDSRRESAISSVSEKDYTKEESSIGIDDKELSTHSHASDKSIEDIRDEVEKTPTKVLSLEKDEIDGILDKPGDTIEKSDITKAETLIHSEIKTKEQVSQETMVKEETLDIDMTDDGVDEVDKVKESKTPEKSPSPVESIKKEVFDTKLETLEFLKAETTSSRPDSAASQTSVKSETRPLSSASHVSDKPALADKIESRPESAANVIHPKTPEEMVDDKKSSPIKSESSPESALSQLCDISKHDSRPISVASHTSDLGLDKEQLSRPESRISDKSRSPSVLSDHFDDEILSSMPATKLVMKETRSKSVASIMTGSMYKEHDDLKPLSALEEVHEYSKDDTDMLPKYLGASKTSISSLSTEKIEKSPAKKSPEPVAVFKQVDMSKSVLDDIWANQPTVPSTDSAKPSSSKTSPSDHHETISLSGKSTPDIADVIEEKKSPEKPKEPVTLESGQKTPPTVPVSPNIKSDIMTQSMMQMTASTTIIEPEIHSGKSSPGLIQTSSESASKSTSVGQGSGIDTTDSSPKPTSPFPKGIQTIKDEVKTSSGMSTPDMTRMSTPDIMDTKYLDKSETGSDSITTITATTITTKTIDSSETSKVIEKSDKVETKPTVTANQPISKDVANLKTSEMRSFTPGMEDYDPHDVSSPRSDISSGQASRVVPGWTPGSSEERHVYSDDEVPSSPMSVTSHAAHSPPSKFAYEDPYDLQRSSSGVSKKSDLDIDDSQDDIPPQYGSEELKSAISISSSYRPDPMSTSFYGALPEMMSTGKSEPIPIAKSGLSAKSHLMEYTSSGPSEDSTTSSFSGTSKEIEITGGLHGGIDHKFLDEADLDFEKALEHHRQVRGADVMSSITSKYEYSPTRHVIDPTSDSSKVPELPKKSGVEPAAVLPTTTQPSTSSSSSSLTQSSSQQSQSTTAPQPPQLTKDKEDFIASWGKPLGLPAPAPIPVENNTTPKKDTVMQQRRMVVNSKTKLNNEKNLRKRSESPVKGNKKNSPIYMDLTYVPHHGNSYYSHVEFFKRVRARYYVFSGTEPSREVYNALLEAKQTWEDKDLEVTIIPTYDTDVLGYWVSENEDLLAKYHIDLSPSASRCTINLQDHETSCSAYRLEF